MDGDRRDAKFTLTVNLDLKDGPKSFVAAVQLPLEGDTEEVANLLATREEWLNTRLVMTRVLQITSSLRELVEF